jgi:hypothetical protein
MVVISMVLAGAVTAGAQNVATITSPANGATVSGQVTIATQESSQVSWINVNVDGVWFASNSPTAARPYSVTWNSTKVSNGSHTVSVDSFGSSNQLLGGNSIKVNVANLAATRTTTRTPTRTPTPRATSTQARTASPAPTPSPAKTAAAYYVSPGGNDNATGTAAAPWRTIQHAASRLLPGQSAVVLGGSYLERVSITSSGTAAALITIRAASGADAKLLGFNISGSYWVIDGFDVSNQSNNTDGYGIYVFRAAAHDTISNNYTSCATKASIWSRPCPTFR